jgi:hypothetical protein
VTFFRVLIIALWVARASAQDVTFRAVDLFVDSGSQPLAAYQLTFHSTDANVKIVGIEGGDHRAFSEPPYYDPQAMQTNHAIIAAFSTASADQLPRGRTRVATIHVRASVAGPLSYKLDIDAAAAVDGKQIAITGEPLERTKK